MISANRYMNTQAGNVLVIILVAVALFAALSFVTSTMMRGGAQVGTEKAGIYVSEILTYARSVNEAVRFMRVSNECDDEAMSFERSPYDGTDADYENANASTDFSCHVFHPRGGGVAFSAMHSEIFDAAYNGDADYGQWVISGFSKILGLGNDSRGELILALPYLKKPICEILAKRVGQSLPIPVDNVAGIDLTKFIGNYASIETYDAADDLMTGCINVTSGGSAQHYTFFSVLISR